MGVLNRPMCDYMCMCPKLESAQEKKKDVLGRCSNVLDAVWQWGSHCELYAVVKSRDMCNWVEWLEIFVETVPT